jgi:ubiquinone/menaquinone biosynthesis C-methylase UbiE
MDVYNSQLAKDSRKLSNRLALNSTTQKINFNKWLFKNMPKIEPQYKILDLGCGTGNQTKYFLKELGNQGRVIAIDASKDSLNLINEDFRLTKYEEDFDNLEKLKETLGNIKFDIINATYSIYYSKHPISLIKFLKENYLKKSGKFIIAGPTWKHQLFSEISSCFGEDVAIRKTIDFMESVLVPNLKDTFGTFSLNYLINISEFKTPEEASLFVKNTIYGSNLQEDHLKKFFEGKDSLNFIKSSMIAIF